MSSQSTETTSLGWYLAVMAVSESGVVTAWPSTEMITSPGARPRDCAAVPHKMPRMSTPASAGAILTGTPGSWPPATQARPAGGPPWLLPPWLVPECRWSAACCWGFGLLLCATSTPRKPGRPMYTVELGWLPAMCRAMASAVLIGMAKPIVPPGCPPDAVFAAVTIPMTCPALLTSAPPESPCWIWALVCSMWFRFSVVFEPSSLAWMERFSPLMLPRAGVTWPRPWASPSARTGMPTLTCEESPRLTVARPEAPVSLSSATSSVLS